MKAGRKLGVTQLQAMFTEIFGFGRAAALSAVVLTGLVMIAGVFWFFYSAPPRAITITRVRRAASSG